MEFKNSTKQSKYTRVTESSRYIWWIHVGIAARTGIAILKQYLNLIEDTHVLPRAIHSDRGTETTMMANAHWRLYRALDSNTSFADIYWYGTSTLNQRIESWWHQMSKSQTLAWKVSIKFYTGTSFV